MHKRLRLLLAFAIFAEVFAFYLVMLAVFTTGYVHTFTKYQDAAAKFIAHSMSPERSLDFSPLYLYFNVLIQKFFSNPDFAVLAGQALLTSLTASMLFLLLTRYFSVWLAFIGATVFALNKSVILYTFSHEPEAFMLFFITGFALFAARNTPRSAFMGGLFLAGSILTRSNFVPLILLTPLIFFLQNNDKYLKQRCLLFLLPVILLTAGLVVRNSQLTGSFNMFGMNAGMVFYESNNPNSNGFSCVYPPIVHDYGAQFNESDVQHIMFRALARRAGGKDLSVPQVNGYWTGKALNFIFDNPLYWLSNTLKRKVIMFFHPFRVHDLDTVFWYDRVFVNKIPAVPFSLISAMAICGILICLKNRKWLLFHAIMLTQFLIVMMVYASDRQRVVVVPFFILFAVAFVSIVFGDLRLRPRSPLSYALVILLIPLSLTLSLPDMLIRDELHNWQSAAWAKELSLSAQDAMAKGDNNTAARKIAEAISYMPSSTSKIRLPGLGLDGASFETAALDFALARGRKKSFSAVFDIGYLYLKNGDISHAEYIFNELAENKTRFNRVYLQSSQPEYYLGLIALLRKDVAAAAIQFKKALEHNPGDPWVLARLYVITLNKEYSRKLFRYFDDIDAHYFLGDAYLDAREPRKAGEEFLRVLNDLPDYKDALIKLAVSAGRSGKEDLAAGIFLNALSGNDLPVRDENDIVRIFQARVKKDPDSLRKKAELEKILIFYGRP